MDTFIKHNKSFLLTRPDHQFLGFAILQRSIMHYRADIAIIKFSLHIFYGDAIPNILLIDKTFR